HCSFRVKHNVALIKLGSEDTSLMRCGAFPAQLRWKVGRFMPPMSPTSSLLSALSYGLVLFVFLFQNLVLKDILFLLHKFQGSNATTPHS
ncbi:hypothetical protein A2U01_0007373, partial [Trifolium medium]|nr:hypothetical protein [Trifolium medium]